MPNPSSGISRSAVHLYLWYGIALLGAAMLLVFVLSGRPFPYSPDSADYIEQARSLSERGVALSTPYDLARPDAISEPSRLFPIGFPIVLALLSTLDLDPSIGAVALNGLAAVLAPILLFFALKPSCGPRLAAIASLLFATTPSLIDNAPFAMTDSFALALSLLVFHLTVNARSSGAHLLSGAIAAFAYVSRNALAALLLSSMVFYIWAVLHDRYRGDSRRQFFCFVLGLSVVLAPYMLRNLAVYGAINPYAMGKSTIGIAENAASMLGAFAYDLSGIAAIQEAIRPFVFVGFLGLLTVTVIAPLVLVRVRHVFNERQWRATIFSAAYVLIGTWTIIMVRSKYQWGEVIDLRHTLQYSPYVVGAACIAVATRFGAAAGTSPVVARLCVFSLAALLLVHARFYSQQLDGLAERNARFGGHDVYASGREFACGREDGAFMVSNWAYVFRIKCEVPARHLWVIDPGRDEGQRHFVGTAATYRSLKQGLDSVAESVLERPIAVALFPGRGGLSRSDFPMEIEEAAALENSGWTIVANSRERILLER